MRNLRGSVPMSLLDVIKNGYFQQVRYLVDRGEDLDQRDEERRTALMLCAFIEPEKWGIGICRLLIENGATLFYRDRYGLNAFHYAVIYERVDLCRVYLKAIDFNLNEGDKNGNTALHYAVRAGNAIITRMIAQMYVKYRINLDRANNDGYTALEEAKRLNKRKCARILENPGLLEDRNSLESNIPLDIKFSDTEAECLSVKSSRRTLSRPRSSMLSQRSSRSSLFTASEYSFRRTPTIYSQTDEASPVKKRMPGDDIPPNEKNNKQLIRCASARDIRNNPEYLFQSSMENGNIELQQGAPKRRMRAKSAHIPRPQDDDMSDSMVPMQSWRTEFRKLYLRYEFQCTPSYRDSVIQDVPFDSASLPPLDKPLTPANSEHTIDDLDKGKKPRGKSAVSRQNTEETLSSAGRNRSNSKANTRKISQNVGHGGKLSVDGLESSSESINSSVSSKKQADGKISKQKDGASGRLSRNNHHKTVPTLTVDDA